MPRSELSSAERATMFARENKNILKADGQLLVFVVCSTKVSYNLRSQVTQHLDSEKHKKNYLLSTRQALITTETQGGNLLYKEIAHAMISANIPLQKLDNPAFMAFLEKWAKITVLSASVVRKTYGKIIYIYIYEECLQKVRQQVGDHQIWIGVDETTDMCKRYVEVIVGGDLVIGKTFLLNCAFLQETNHSTASKLIMDSLYLLYPQGIKYDNILLLVTDGAAYTKKCYKDVIKAFFFKNASLYLHCAYVA